jgi:hypothetical protein
MGFPPRRIMLSVILGIGQAVRIGYFLAVDFAFNIKERLDYGTLQDRYWD